MSPDEALNLLQNVTGQLTVNRAATLAIMHALEVLGKAAGCKMVQPPAAPQVAAPPAAAPSPKAAAN